MLPIIDRYILSRFLYNFFSSFAILMVIFIFQTVWLFIDDLAGKDLDIGIIAKFLFYYMPTLVDKVLPLTVLLASLLTFGAFAENYEFAAMKASGVSLQKAMRSIIVFVIFLGVSAFFLANNIIPASEQKIFNMRRNIAKVKPAAVIVEGVFSDIEGTDMNMKVAKKSGDKDQYLNDVIIHQKSKTNLNTTVIKAETGELISSEESDIIQLVLKNGYRYEEMQPKSAKDKRKHPFTRADFETYISNIDVSDLNNQDIEAESDIMTDKMKNVVRLTKDIDSLRDNNLNQVKAFSKNVYIRMGAFPVVDSLKKDAKKIKTAVAKKTDSTANINDLVSLVPEWQQSQLYNNAKNVVTNVLNTVNGKKKELEKRYEIYNRHILSFHKKFALAFACIILFFVGAPLGAIIRKGGLGLPMVIAIILFLTYYFIGVFAENWAKKDKINPMLGAWLSTIIMLPLSIYLTKRATADRGLMGDGNIFASLAKLFKKKSADNTENQMKYIEESISGSLTITNEEMNALKDSLVTISSFVNSLNFNSGSEFIKIHERNLKTLILLKRTDDFGLIGKQLIKYPKITAEEIDFFLKKKRKEVSITEFAFGKLVSFLVNLVKTKGNSLKAIEQKLDDIKG